MKLLAPYIVLTVDGNTTLLEKMNTAFRSSYELEKKLAEALNELADLHPGVPITIKLNSHVQVHR